MAKMAGLDASRFDDHECDHEDCELCFDFDCEPCAEYRRLQGCGSCGAEYGCFCDAQYDAWRDAQMDDPRGEDW